MLISNIPTKTLNCQDMKILIKLSSQVTINKAPKEI